MDNCYNYSLRWKYELCHIKSSVVSFGENKRTRKSQMNYTVLQKYAHIGLKQNLLRSITLVIITRLLDNAAFVYIHVVGRFSKDFSEVRGLRS